MIKKHLYTLLFALIAFLMISFRTDTDPESNLLNALINKVQNHYNWYPQQKAYLHTDKSDYKVDETIWFKAYVVDATTHRPDQMSTNLYVDLIDPSGMVVQTRLLKLKNGLAHGDFSFQDTIPEGRYKIRAYTNWMRNLGEAYFFSKNVYVSNPLFSTYATRIQVQKIKKGQREIRNNINDYDLSFHPEGGSLLAGVENVIGFKAINGLGMGVRFEGSLMDRKGNKLMDITSNYLGMGSFAFTPEEGEKYAVEAIFNNSSPRKYKLPESLDMGVNISIEHAGRDSIYIRLKSNIEPGDYPPNTDYHLFAHTRGKVKYTAVLDLKEKPGKHTIPKDIFPSGVTHFTLFNANSNPVSERLIFINQDDFLDIDISGNPSINDKREKVSSKIMVRDSEGEPVKGDFSLAIVNGTELLQGENILTELLLDSDLKGNIEDPSYYFENTQNFKEKELDDLMLTQGWRRFDWPTVLVNRKISVQHQIENGIEIGGRITREFFGLPLRDIKVTLTILNEFNDVFVTRSDLKGYFSFENLSYPDTVGVKIEAVRHSGRKNLVITVDQKDPANIEDMYYMTEQNLKKPGEEGRWVTEKTPEEIEKENDPFYEENNRYYRIHQEPGDVIIVDETLRNYGSVAQIIQGRVPGVVVNGDNIIIRGINSLYTSTDPLFIVDGVPVDKSLAMNLNPYDIDRIEILKGSDAAIYGSRGGNGVIAIFTQRGKFMLKGVVDFEMIGYYTPKEFYSPRYEAVNQNDPFEDDRTTLYWEPNLITGENGIAEFSFYTSDIEGDYFIIVEGINQDGEPGVGKSSFRIR